jgi:hypothetical protein
LIESGQVEIVGDVPALPVGGHSAWDERCGARCLSKNLSEEKAADFSTAFIRFELADLPARAGAKSDPYAARSDTDADAGPLL